MDRDVAVVSFDHPHVTTNLRWIDEHPNADLVALCDEHSESTTGSMVEAAEEYGVPTALRFHDLDACLREATPDVVVITANHVEHGDLTERAAAVGAHIVVEKPFAYDLAEADRMIAACDAAGVRLAINWPYAWSPSVRTIKRAIEEGRIGAVREVHYYGGHRGPPPRSWFYDPERGGGSLLDFAGYGATFSTWFRDGELAETVSTRAHVPDDLEVDTQSVTIAEYPTGLSTFHTTWQAVTDPWVHGTRPPNGFTVIGTEGAITDGTADGDLRIRTEENPAATRLPPDEVEHPCRNAIEYVIHCLETGAPFEGPISPALSRVGQRIVDAARRSAEVGETVPLE